MQKILKRSDQHSMNFKIDVFLRPATTDESRLCVICVDFILLLIEFFCDVKILPSCTTEGNVS